MTAECKVPAAAVDVPTEGGCGVSGPFDYEYANAACHESRGEKKREGGGGKRTIDKGLQERGRRSAFIFLLNAFMYFIGFFFFRRWSKAQFVSQSQ